MRYLAVLLMVVPIILNAAEYKAAEETAPKSVDDISNTLANVAGKILLTRGPVVKAIDDWRKTRKPFLRDGHVDFNFRTMDFNAEIVDLIDTRAWAAPGEFAYRSGQWRNFLTIGASVYGSYEISGNESSGASGLLQLNGDNITTLGQAYVEFNWKSLIGRFYRQALDYPYINRNDSRMIPSTFEAYGIARENTSLDFLVGYVSKIKRRNREDFISMGEAAGVDDSDSGTVLLGILWKPPATGFEWGATLQHTEDVLRLVYTEANWTKTVSGLGMRASAQYTHQKSTGLGLLGKFKTNAKGVKLSTSYKDAVLSVSYTKTGDGASIRSPFGGRPGYTSSMLRNFDRAGEKAWRASLSYHFDSIGLPDWSANVMYMSGTGGLSDIIFDELQDNREVDYTLDYKPDHGRWQGLWFRVRYAHVREDGRGGVANQLRIILNYSFSIL